MSRPLNLENLQFGRLKVIKRCKENDKNGRTIWLCQCNCGNSKFIKVLGHYLVQNQTTSCGCKKKERCINLNKNSWKGIGDLGRTVLSTLKHSAKNRKWKCNISLEFLWNLFLKQDRKCALSGVELNVKNFKDRKKYTGSIDRIDSSKDYNEDNIQWVHKFINYMKQDMTDEEFIFWCKLVAEHNKT